MTIWDFQWAEGALLPGPNHVDMSTRIPETLKASITVMLSELATGRVIVESTGACTGLEAAGQYERVIAAFDGRLTPAGA